MAFATDKERKSVCRDVSFPVDFVVRVRKNGRESELCADDIDHALDLNAHWSDVFEAEYVEIFRVLDDGSLNATIGPCGKDYK